MHLTNPFMVATVISSFLLLNIWPLIQKPSHSLIVYFSLLYCFCDFSIFPIFLIFFGNCFLVIGCGYFFLRLFLPSFLPLFLPCFLYSFLLSFLGFFVPSLLSFFLFSFLSCLVFAYWDLIGQPIDISWFVSVCARFRLKGGEREEFTCWRNTCKCENIIDIQLE